MLRAAGYRVGLYTSRIVAFTNAPRLMGLMLTTMR